MTTNVYDTWCTVKDNLVYREFFRSRCDHPACTSVGASRGDEYEVIKIVVARPELNEVPSSPVGGCLCKNDESEA